MRACSPSTEDSVSRQGEAASAARLPFHDLLADPWKVIVPQLTPATIPTLLSLALPLKLDVDLYHYHLARRIVRTMAKRVKEAQAADRAASGLRGCLSARAPCVCVCAWARLFPSRLPGLTTPVCLCDLWGADGTRFEPSPARSISRRTVEHFDTRSVFSASPNGSRVVGTVIHAGPGQAPDQELFDPGVSVCVIMWCCL